MAVIISSQQIKLLLELYGGEQARKIGAGSQGEVREAPEAAGDRAELSAEALLYQKVREAARQVPEVRAERVERIKAEIERGSYEVPLEEVAAKMIGRTLADNFA